MNFPRILHLPKVVCISAGRPNHKFKKGIVFSWRNLDFDVYHLKINIFAFNANKAPGKSVTEINVTSSVSSSIHYSLVRNAMEIEIPTVHKSLQMKTHFFFQGHNEDLEICHTLTELR